ncbi:hypothetical protein GH714_032678 [Hevea brasiliensis]|uniref:L-ascorbate oxidase n=1 Tax=Hevea brasiliensis TaxID=3981 RepID=A0A6A6K9W5_HEVBR|nr:hypothetical protein GH714_032678 [Hevea brasiliensis]
MGDHRISIWSFMGVALLVTCISGEDPYRFYTWNVTYGYIYPLGEKQQGILINGQFPGPQIESVTNDNLIINVFNSLDEPFLISWNGVQQRRNSWQDGVYGTNCPIPPGQNFTYVLQVKDQIGSYFYFPSLGMHKAAGGFGSFKIASRSVIPVPFPPPAGDFTILAGDWFKRNHTDLRAILDGGTDLPFPHGLLINGRGSNGYTFTVDQGKTYRFRISNVGLTTSLNFRIQGHKMLLVEVEGTHTLQNTYDSLDIHLGQSYSVLVTADQPAQDYNIVISTRFTTQVLTTTSILHYSNSAGSVSGPPPGGPTTQIDWSLEQARSLRPLQYSGAFSLGSIPDNPTGGGAYLQTSVMAADFRGYAEIVFENPEETVQSWHIDGHNFFVVGFLKDILHNSDGQDGRWAMDTSSRLSYNLRDTISRCTVQVYPKSWTAVYMPLDNVGMWNVRSENWPRQYLGQQFYLRVFHRQIHGEMNIQSQEMFFFVVGLQVVRLGTYDQHTAGLIDCQEWLT